jgi:hypothetical protein
LIHNPTCILNQLLSLCHQACKTCFVCSGEFREQDFMLQLHQDDIEGSKGSWYWDSKHGDGYGPWWTLVGSCNRALSWSRCRWWCEWMGMRWSRSIISLLFTAPLMLLLFDFIP